MGEAKIEVALGALSFSGEGDQEWLSKQLDKIIEAAPSLARIEPYLAASANEASPNPGPTAPEGVFTQTIASYIKAKQGDTNQQRRFLATANWLRRRGNTNLTTAAVTKALQDHHQKRLSNPADCLNKNVNRGYCEKTGDGFFITTDGLALLGN
jgi:hypothetical protein